MHLLFLTTANLSSNPRLVKEIQVALSLNYKVTALLFDLKQWTTELEEEYVEQFYQVKFIYLPVSKSNFFIWFTSSLLNYFAKKFYKVFKTSVFVSALASDKRSYMLHQKLKDLKIKSVDLVIAHNLGALYPASQYALLNNIPFGFDVEDYHPGEVIHADSANEKRRREFMMQQVLPNAAYVTAASPLIAREVERLCNVKAEVINNTFYSYEFELPTIYNLPDNKLRLIWFSQNINQGRGLELLLATLDSFSDAIKLTLIGNLNSTFDKQWLQHRDYIKVIAPLKQDMLHKELSNYDVGLALELSTVDINKEIALSNKIFAYKQSGLFVMATDTKAQVDFMKKYKEDGYVCKQTEESMKEGIRYILDNITAIRAEKRYRFNKAKEIAFEMESQKLVTLWS